MFARVLSFACMHTYTYTHTYARMHIDAHTHAHITLKCKNSYYIYNNVCK